MLTPDDMMSCLLLGNSVIASTYDKSPDSICMQRPECTLNMYIMTLLLPVDT